jgi:hypothetical protein
MTLAQLKRKYAEVFGEETRSHHKHFLFRRIPVTSRQRAGTVWRAASDLRHIQQASLAIRNAHDHRAVMQQGTVETGDRGLLATVLGGGGRENATDLTDESPAEPELPGLVQKVPHLRAHVAESGWRAEDNGIGFG